MDTARFSFCRILVALSMVCFAANLYSGEPLRQRTFAMDGYRPVTLPEYKIVAENPFPLSKGEKNSLLDSVSRVCRTCLGKYPDRNLDTWIVRLIFGRRPYNSFSNFSRIIIGRMRGLRFTAILRARKESLTICWLTITIVRKSQTEAR